VMDQNVASVCAMVLSDGVLGNCTLGPKMGYTQGAGVHVPCDIFRKSVNS
jgi:hypothetical protein